jgi:CRP-like cAMP-binding protein
MAIDSLVAPLLRVALFQGLRPLQITEIARRAERIMFRPGQTIVEAGAEGDAAFILISGVAERIKGPDMGPQPETIAVGSLIGEMAMLVDTEYSSTIIAQTAVRALKITRTGMYDQMNEDLGLAEHLVAKIAARLQVLAVELRAIDRRLAGDDEVVAEDVATAATASRALMLEAVRPTAETRH